MTRASQRSRDIINYVYAFSLLFSLVQAQCNTNQNPYCRGNAKLESLCCPYPNVCYWSNRNGDPACCAAGQVCIDSGGNQVTAQAIQQTTTTQSQTQPLSTITSYVTHAEPTTAGGGGVVYVTTNEPYCHACNTVTSAVGGAFSTVTSFVGGAVDTAATVGGSVVTGVATDIAQDLNGASSRLQVPCEVLLAVGMGLALGVLV